MESLKTCFCMCKACAPDRTVNVGQSRATPGGIQSEEAQDQIYIPKAEGHHVKTAWTEDKKESGE